jgi:hypothetical protein
MGSDEFVNYVALCRRWPGAAIECVYGDARHTSRRDVRMMARLNGFRVVDVLSRLDVEEIRRGTAVSFKKCTVEYVRKNLLVDNPFK